MTARRNSPIPNDQTWTPGAEGVLPGGWRWLRVRELTRMRHVVSGRDSAQLKVYDYVLRGNVVVVQMRWEWGRPDAGWRALDARTLELLGRVLRRLEPGLACEPGGCGS